jgi:hypothetical protein
MSFLILFANCNTYNDSLIPQRAEFSGEELFKSIYFGEGEFAKNIVQLEKIAVINEQISDENRKEFDQKTSELISSIKKSNPTFFNDFKMNISSANHQNIQLWINKGGYELGKTLSIIFPEIEKTQRKVKQDLDKGRFNPNDFESVLEYEKELISYMKNKNYEGLIEKNMITGEGAEIGFPVWAIALAVYFAVVVHNSAAVTALIYFKVAFWGPKFAHYAKHEKSSNQIKIGMSTEILINEIAEYYYDSIN